MGNAIIRVVSLLVVILVGATFEVRLGADEPDGARPNALSATSSEFFAGFEAGNVGREFADRFMHNPEFHALENFKVSPPGESFKTFRMKGDLSGDECAQLLSELSEQLVQLAQESKVDEVGPLSNVTDRPISVLQLLLPTKFVEVKSIRGFYFRYQQGTVTGAADVIAVRIRDRHNVNSSLTWYVVCAVHENRDH